ncbi:glycosyltransferase [Robertmurraya sp. GLU-23]
MKKTIIIVFYNQSIEASKTFQTLMNNSQEFLSEDISIILYDNSPNPQEFDQKRYEDINISYKHDPRNLGIATAYNYAWSVAKSNGSEWLVLFDHDTEVTRQYVQQMLEVKDVDRDIAAVVPIISCDGTLISPVFSDTLRPLQQDRPLAGIQQKPVMAINSASLIKISFLNQINGFNESFALDYLDHWIFYEIYSKGFKVQVLDVSLEHELSVMDYSRVSVNRYKSIIDSESYFYQHYHKELLPAYRSQLFKRLIKQFLIVKNKRIAMQTLKKFLSLK